MHFDFSVAVPIQSTDQNLLDKFFTSLIAQKNYSWQLFVEGPETLISSKIKKKLPHTSTLVFIEKSENFLDVALELVDASNLIICSPFVEFVPHAFRELIDSINDSSPVVLYCFEKHIDLDNQTSKTVEKPSWSPIRYIQQSYLGHLVVLNSEYCRMAGGFGNAVPEVSIYDIVLRISKISHSIKCIQSPLISFYLSSEAKISSEKRKTNYEGRLLAAQRESNLSISSSPSFSKFDIKWVLDRKTPTSVIIPTRGSRAFVKGMERTLVVDALISLYQNTEHENFEVILVIDSDADPQLLADVKEIGINNVKYVFFDKPFNFSQKCNLGALHSVFENLVFLNDDVEILSSDFLETLISPLNDENVGQVGVTMFYEDGTIQHAGHAYSHGQYLHPYAGLTMDEASHQSTILNIDREVSGVTAACVALRKDTFIEIGGFCEFLPGNFNDVDFSMKIESIKKSTLLLHNLWITHYESKTRINTVKPGEVEFMRDRWGYQNFDPYFTQDFGLELGY